MTIAAGKYAMVKTCDGCSNDQKMPQIPVSARARRRSVWGTVDPRQLKYTAIYCLVALNLRTKSGGSLAGPNADRGS